MSEYWNFLFGIFAATIVAMIARVFIIYRIWRKK